MNFLRTVILTLISLNSFGQIEFKNDSIRDVNYREIIGDPTFDTIQLTLRFWKEIERIPGTFLELTLSYDKWSYRTGYIDFNKKELIIKEKDDRQVNLDSIWNELNKLHILSIKKQIESTWKGTNDKGQNYTVRTNRETYDRNGKYYTIELISNQGYRQISYIDPEGLIKYFEQIPATSTDHEQIVKIASILSTTFDIDKIMRLQLYERFSKTNKQTKDKN